MDNEIEAKLKSLEERAKELEKLLVSPEILKDREKLVKLSQESSEISQILAPWKRYCNLKDRITEAQHLLSSQDEELKRIAKEELDELQKEKQGLELEIIDSLSPKDSATVRNVIMEIRQGAGGDEASVFARDLFRMYSKYAESKNWQIEILNSHPTEIGGFKELIFLIKGKGAYGRLKYESGVHRVQRVPVTESSGRIHTSTASVAVLPEVSPIDAKIDSKDIKMEAFRASGHGGQNVNKVSSAVRLTYIPQNITVVCQDERSQYQNRVRAMKILLARVYELERKKQDAKISAVRKEQVGDGERSEKIRTYNYPQQRFTDHRINLTLYKLDSILNGALDGIIDKLQNENRRTSHIYNTILSH